MGLRTQTRDGPQRPATRPPAEEGMGCGGGQERGGWRGGSRGSHARSLRVHAAWVGGEGKRAPARKESQDLVKLSGEERRPMSRPCTSEAAVGQGGTRGRHRRRVCRLLRHAESVRGEEGQGRGLGAEEAPEEGVGAPPYHPKTLATKRREVGVGLLTFSFHCDPTYTIVAPFPPNQRHTGQHPPDAQAHQTRRAACQGRCRGRSS